MLNKHHFSLQISRVQHYLIDVALSVLAHQRVCPYKMCQRASKLEM